MDHEAKSGAKLGAKEGAVWRERRGELLVLTLDHPPGNAITHGLIAALDEALEEARRAAGVSAVMIEGAGEGFSAGMDPAAFGQADEAAALGALARRIEDFPLPVTAALGGRCLGAGLELAMACHWRIASEAAVFALPEIHLGLVPGAGGSQRLPRLVGGRHALRLLLDGEEIGAAEALALGLVDAVAGADAEGLFAAAVAFAGSRPGVRPTRAERGRLSDLFGPDGALAEARERVAGHRLPAPAQVVDCVEAAGLLPFEQGLGREAAAFADLAATPEAAGLRAASVAERRAGEVPQAVGQLGEVPITSLGLWAPGEHDVGMMVRALGTGMRIYVAAADRPGVVEILNRVAARQEVMVAEGSLSEAARDADWARLMPMVGAPGLGAADVILAGEEAPADLPLERRAIPGGVPFGVEGVGLTLPDEPGGPAEVAMSEGADPALAALCLALARRLEARAVFTGPGGPILGRLRNALGLAIAGLEVDGVAREAITAALAGFGVGTGSQSHLPAMPEGGEAILRACLAALAAEGGRMVEEGVARRPLDVDAVAIAAGLFPRWEGGPMAWADRLGLLVLRADLWKRSEALPEAYQSPVLFDRLIGEGKRLASLNGSA